MAIKCCVHFTCVLVLGLTVSCSSSQGDRMQDGDVEEDAGGDNRISFCAGGLYDSFSRLCWQNPPSEELFHINLAVSYCNTLDIGGHDTWSLPTIDELRSLISGCSATENSGACRITEHCLGEECWDANCRGCTSQEGSGASIAYWPDRFMGPVDMYWSSSPSPVVGANDWYAVNFISGGVFSIEESVSMNFRCVRRER